MRADIGAFETELVVDSLDIPFREANGQVVMEAEHFTWYLRRGEQAWLSQTNLAGYSGSGYLSALPDTDLQFAITDILTNPELQYTANFTTTGVYILWLRGYAPNGAGDSLYVSLDNQPAITLTGFIPQVWSWANKATDDTSVTFEITQPGLHTLHLWTREDGLQLDRIILTTDGVYTPTGNGPLESERD